MNIDWLDLHHSELNVRQVYDMLKLRNTVFIVEQNCVYQDIDGQDLTGENRHILGVLDGALVASARILAPDVAGSAVKIGRVIVSGEARGLKLGNRLMEQAVRSGETHWPGNEMFLAAQAHLEALYRQFGFNPVGNIYLEDNIPHIDMVRKA